MKFYWSLWDWCHRGIPWHSPTLIPQQAEAPTSRFIFWRKGNKLFFCSDTQELRGQITEVKAPWFGLKILLWLIWCNLTPNLWKKVLEPLDVSVSWKESPPVKLASSEEETQGGLLPLSAFDHVRIWEADSCPQTRHRSATRACS